jgi:hypothetical protein
MRSQSLTKEVNFTQHSEVSAKPTGISESHWPFLRTNLLELPIGQV